MQYTFSWDPQKAATNLRKHGVSFERTATIFLDSQAISIPDEEHSEQDERWVTLGLDSSAGLLVAVHTFEQVDAARCRIRLIPGRKATKKEVGQYAKVK